MLVRTTLSRRVHWERPSVYNVGYNNMSPTGFRSMLDRLGPTMPSTHSGARGTGAELEKHENTARILS